MSKEKQPNVLILFTDDQRFNTIHALGNEEIITPNLDRLAARGTVFTHAHIPGGTSGAVCMPSRAMLHTGRTLFHLEKEGQTIPKEHVTMAETFRKAGYRTFGTGKWHNGTDAFHRGFTDGSSIFFGGMWDHWNVPVCDLDPTGCYDNQINFIQDFMGSNRTTSVHCDGITPGKHSTELISDAALDFLDTLDGEQPFFMYVSYLAPHDPRSMPDKFLKLYDPDKIQLPENFKEEHPFDYGVRDIRDEVLAPYPRTPALIKQHIAEYYGMISHLDHELGSIMGALEEKDMLEDTIIVFAGDNGLALGQHGLMGKQNLYDHSIRIPLLFAGPGIPENQKRNDFIYLLDIFPTLCDLLEIEIPVSVEGESFARGIRNEGTGQRETLYLAYTEKIRGVRDERYKLIVYRGEGCNRTQLFDTTADPMEMNDLVGKEEYADTVVRLEAVLKQHCDAWEDQSHGMGKAFWEQY